MEANKGVHCGINLNHHHNNSFRSSCLSTFPLSNTDVTATTSTASKINLLKDLISSVRIKLLLLRWRERKVYKSSKQKAHQRYFVKQISLIVCFREF